MNEDYSLSGAGTLPCSGCQRLLRISLLPEKNRTGTDLTDLRTGASPETVNVADQQIILPGLENSSATAATTPNKAASKINGDKAQKGSKQQHDTEGIADDRPMKVPMDFSAGHSTDHSPVTRKRLETKTRGKTCTAPRRRNPTTGPQPIVAETHHLRVRRAQGGSRTALPGTRCCKRGSQWSQRFQSESKQAGGLRRGAKIIWEEDREQQSEDSLNDEVSGIATDRIPGEGGGGSQWQGQRLMLWTRGWTPGREVSIFRMPFVRLFIWYMPLGISMPYHTDRWSRIVPNFPKFST